jgi:hypothetical protein
MYLFQFSICFEQHHAHHQDNQLYQYKSGIFHSVSVTVSCAGRKVTLQRARETVTDIARQVGHLTRIIAFFNSCNQEQNKNCNNMCKNHKTN